MSIRDYLITDESSLHDFAGVNELELRDIQRKIRDVYDLDVAEMQAGNLLKIFMAIHKRRYGDPS
ncbi:MAG: hypothetical protein NTW86_12995 [Candidatus Sumerlaeota bacterium]|nr:hypothetical protein [Candidatus Sumerlaeota bacterium]